MNNTPIIIGNDLLYNFRFKHKSLVYNASEKQVFTLNDESLIPEEITSIKSYKKHFFYARLEGINKLCSVKGNEIITLEDQTIEIKQIDANSSHKLVNFLSANDENYVLDMRLGLDNISLAKVDGHRVIKTVGEIAILGDTAVQNVVIETLGGPKKRAINLNENELEIFRLPNDLNAYSEYKSSSKFANNIVTEIDFENEIRIENKTFLNAQFLTYLNEPLSIIIQKENGRPLQLDGLGHRNEMVQNFDIATIKNEYHLSSHRIIKANTLTEDLNSSSLIFSSRTMSSWLPFYDTYLPIFKNIIDFEDQKQWKYHLLEVHNIAKEKEYVAVEQKPPYRILADKKKSNYRPRIVKSKEIILKSPEEISTLWRIFSNPGHLVEIG